MDTGYTKNVLELRCGDHTLCYRKIPEAFAVITGVMGNVPVIKLPEKIHDGENELSVVGIDKKAFLGCTQLRRVELPASIAKIDDWAFAQCSHLTEVILHRNVKEKGGVFGRRVFEDCEALRDICVGCDDKNSLSALLAALSCKLTDEHLMSDMDLGTAAWFARWDERLRTFLEEPDSEGYTNLALCGEEDIRSDIPEYIMDKRIKKSGLCLLRLLKDEQLSAEHRLEFTEYILAHKKGQDSDAAWQFILREHPDDMEYYALYAELGGMGLDNIDEMLNELGERHAEAKAFLMDYKSGLSGDDIFSAFEL